MKIDWRPLIISTISLCVVQAIMAFELGLTFSPWSIASVQIGVVLFCVLMRLGNKDAD